MFVTFEGIDGSGKTSALVAVVDALREGVRTVTVTREPSDGPIRDMLLHGESLPIMAEALLFQADRAINMTKVVLPALERGETVLCDRHIDSTIAYQGYGRGLNVEMLRVFNEASTGGLKPDLTLLLDLPPELAQTRLGLLELDRIDAEGLEFHQRVRDGFLRAAELYPQRVQVIDATKSRGEVSGKCLRLIERYTE